MVPVTPGAFVFDSGALVKVRSALGLSQAAMAARLGIPQNTVSRWETGATTPDAHSLAAFYSVAQEVGLMVTFFTKANPVPALAACYWDMVSLPVDALAAPAASGFFTGLMEQRAQGAERMLLKVFANPQHDRATDALEKLNWRVWQDDGAWEGSIFNQVLSDIGHDPERSIVFVATANDKHIDLVKEARERGARVYVVTPAPPLTFVPTQPSQLVRAAGTLRHIEWPQVWPIVWR